jgi:hypothetical protein
MICKVQRSLTHGGERMLIYSRNHTIFVEGPIAGDVAELLGPDQKIFVEARLVGRGGYAIARRLAPEEWPTW